MQEFEKEKGGAFFLLKTSFMDKLDRSKIDAGVLDASIFRAYGTPPDFILFRQYLIKEGVLDDDAYFELIDNSKPIPYGVLDTRDVCGLFWNEQSNNWKIFTPTDEENHEVKQPKGMETRKPTIIVNNAGQMKGAEIDISDVKDALGTKDIIYNNLYYDFWM